VWRIPGLNGEAYPAHAKPAVFMQHGILDSANAWVMNWENVAPAFVTARAGYDVWLGNSRGNTYSLGHTKYDHDKNEAKYWAFDWEQMGQYDLPAVIDHIVAKTGNQKITYIGHSQGTT
jgi:pimeloyl-ACP methyl ester carboxylesterase